MQINDRYEFPLQLDLDREDGRYLSPDADRSIRNHYTLHRSAKFPFFCSQKELFNFSVITVSYFKPCLHSLHGEYCWTLGIIVDYISCQTYILAFSSLSVCLFIVVGYMEDITMLISDQH
jgi:hypothetical protein